jgi:DUF4097 and DUF4098 domain-containing protein YvlB
MKTLLIGSIIFLSSITYAQTQEFDAKGIKEVEVANTSGKINITATKTEKISVVTTKLDFSDQKCKLQIAIQGQKLVVKVENQSMFNLADCEVNLDIQAPKITNLNLSMGAGNIKVSDIEGNLKVSLGAGDISADGKFSRLDGKSGAGSIYVKGLTGGGTVKTGSGKVSLIFAKAPLQGEMNVMTGSGDAVLEFAKGAKIRTSFAAGVGEMINEIGDTVDAPFRVVMKSGAGGLRIKSH